MNSNHQNYGNLKRLLTAKIVVISSLKLFIFKGRDSVLSKRKRTSCHEDAFVRSYKSDYSSYRVPLYRLVLSIYFSTTDLVHDHAAEQSTFFLSIIEYVTMDFEIRFLSIGHITLSPLRKLLQSRVKWN